ncbi:tetratricopeptide repeat protein [Flavobacterium sp.]|uniref:tetratricopeptide repeat protein n=1 Tax=Flavobacterium sp. TaxID=239 RepID=UPI0040475A07
MKKGVVLFCFFIFSFLQSQNRDGYSHLYNSFSKVQFSNPPESKQYLDSILLLPKLHDSLISKTYNDIGIYHAIIGDYDGAITSFKKAYSIDKNSSVETKANILCNIANTQKLFGKFDLALQNLAVSKKMYASISDEKNLLKVESEVSAVYYNQSNYNKALEISTDLIPRLAAFGDEKLLNIQLLRLANIQFNVGDYQSAIENYTKILPYFSKDIGNNLQNKYIALMNIGECYAELNDAKALSFLKQSLEGFRSISDKRNEHFCMGRIGKYYYKSGKYDLSLPYLKNSFAYLYENLPHLSLELFSYYLKNLDQLNRISEVEKAIRMNFDAILTDANLQEKIFYYETLAGLYQKTGNQSLQFDCLKKLQTLYQEREKNNTFEELQKKLNVYELNNAIDKNKTLELKVSNLKLQNAVILISVLLLVVLIVFDKQRKKNKIQELSLLQLEQEKVLHEKRAKLKDVELQLNTEISQAKERELTALQLKIYQIKEKVLDYIKQNEIALEKKQLNAFVKKIEKQFDNDDYWEEFQLKFTNMHPNFVSTVKNDYPELTKKDIDFLILIKLNLSNKEIATLINISYESVISKRYLLRKKMNVDSDNELLMYLLKL